MSRKHKKARNLEVTHQFLGQRTAMLLGMGFGKTKWIEFCETMLARGYSMTLYEALETRSKYITVRRDNKEYKVRFSNHPPIKAREVAGDCDFFVGKTHLATTNTSQAIMATLQFFEGA